MGIFLAVQDMVLSHRAKFQLIVIFFVQKLFLPDYPVKRPFVGRQVRNKSVAGSV